MQKFLVIKLGVIAFISLLLLIPLGLISGKIDERASYLAEAKRSVAQSWTSDQTVMGALIVLPYTVKKEEVVFDANLKVNTTRSKIENRYRFVVPTSMNFESEVKNDIRYKGIYKIPVYTSNIQFAGKVSVDKLNQTRNFIKNTHGFVEFKQPFLTATVSDPRGINSIPVLTWQGEEISFSPGSNLKNGINGIHAKLPGVDGVTAKHINFQFDLSLRGMEDLTFVPIGAEVEVNAKSDWPHPQFTGAFLPVASKISDKGYQANWQVTSFASNIFEKITRCESFNCQSLLSGGFGVKHIETVDIYLQSERSVKYGMLFIGLSFISFFLFEVMMKLPIHPIQYALVGVANAIFYLLLISLSENMSFLLSYVIASVACVLLLFFYLTSMLRSSGKALAFSSAILVLYTVLYVIISMEDLALMMGSFLTFIALAVTMFTTRNIDWYEVGENLKIQNTKI